MVLVLPAFIEIAPPLSSGMMLPCVNGCVNAKGNTPRTKNSGRSGIRGRIGSKVRKERRVRVTRREVYVDRWVR